MVKSTGGLVKTSSMVMVAGAMLAFHAPSAVAQTAGNLRCNGCVGSKDIKNSGVKRRDIKNNAVDGAKVRNGSLTGADLRDGSLTGADLQDSSVTGAQVQDGSLTGVDLQNGSVGTPDLADGAVNFAKLAEDAVFMRTVVVSPVGPASTDNCDELRAALNGITDNSASNRYLIYLEPGIYECGSTPLTMKSFIDIRGAGQRLTEITGGVSSNNTTGMVVAASDSELGHLSVTNRFTGGGNSYALVSVGTDIVVSHVTLTGFPPGNQSNGMRINGGRPTLEHVTAIARDSTNTHGIHALNGAVVAMDSVTGRSAALGSNSSGLYLTGSGTTVTARNSVFSGWTRGVFVDSTTTANLTSTQVNDRIEGTGTARCVASYDGAFAELGAGCL